jgi:transposase
MTPGNSALDWPSPALTDIHDRAAKPGRDVQNGHHGRETEAATRSFSDEYKAEVVELCRTSGKSIAEVAGDLGLTVSAVRRWVGEADIDAGWWPGMTSEELAELVQLRRENGTTSVLRADRRSGRTPCRCGADPTLDGHRVARAAPDCPIGPLGSPVPP